LRACQIKKTDAGDAAFFLPFSPVGKFYGLDNFSAKSAEDNTLFKLYFVRMSSRNEKKAKGNRAKRVAKDTTQIAKAQRSQEFLD
jgi:hypothetical protein